MYPIALCALWALPGSRSWILNTIHPTVTATSLRWPFWFLSYDAELSAAFSIRTALPKTLIKLPSFVLLGYQRPRRNVLLSAGAFNHGAVLWSRPRSFVNLMKVNRMLLSSDLPQCIFPRHHHNYPCSWSRIFLTEYHRPLLHQQKYA